MKRRVRGRRAPVSAAEVVAAAEVHRRALGLLSAEDTEAWLRDRGLTIEDWTARIERQLRAARRTDGRAIASFEAGPEVVAAMVAAASAARRARRRRSRGTAAARAPLDLARAWHVPVLRPMDCGAAAVAAVCRFHGMKVSVSDARTAIGSDATGTSLIGIARGARALGLDARTIKASSRNLDVLPLPAVAHVDGDHWVVVYDVGADHVRVSDPARGLLRLDRGVFTARWSGYAAILAPPRRGQELESRSTTR